MYLLSVKKINRYTHRQRNGYMAIHMCVCVYIYLKSCSKTLPWVKGTSLKDISLEDPSGLLTLNHHSSPHQSHFKRQPMYLLPSLSQQVLNCKENSVGSRKNHRRCLKEVCARLNAKWARQNLTTSERKAVFYSEADKTDFTPLMKPGGAEGRMAPPPCLSSVLNTWLQVKEAEAADGTIAQQLILTSRHQ